MDSGVLPAVPIQLRKHDVIDRLLRESIQSACLVGVAFSRGDAVMAQGMLDVAEVEAEMLDGMMEHVTTMAVQAAGVSATESIVLAPKHRAF